MTVTVNGEERELADGATVAEVVASLTESRRGVAVAVNGLVVPRSEWADTRLSGGQQLEVLRAVQGG